MSPEHPAIGELALERRSSLRQVLPQGVPASIHLPSGQTGFVTLVDISRTGACIARQGSLEVKTDDEISLDVNDSKLLQNVALPAIVKWINNWCDKTHIGLFFAEGPLLPGTLLDQYLDRALLVPQTLDA